MIRKLFRLSTAFLLLTVLPPCAFSFTFNPSLTVLRLPTDIGGATLVLKNPRDVDLPVVFEMVERQITEDGAELTEPADNDFVIFPPQAVVPAGKSQAVRIQWVGGMLSQSRSFTLFATEVPVNLNPGSKTGPAIKTVLRIGSSVHVTSRGFAPKPELVGYRPRQDGVVVSIGNSGNEFIYIDKLAMKFGGEKIGGIDLANAARRTLIPPGAIRTFKVNSVQGAPELIFNN
ncbi:Pili and flagellar-assembly chaperone, PapD N-terminal domain [Microbulbifer donghaiensis]|uniref:Pili and flagellar-assembly chaperone, PapD N-terminal domain n=1 Tax=Microbulbifer donghaiensis TaxID=494016 RepID=A0A1M5ECG2_9GAMM|nr:fimbria/pilus periplasmic chaperone [Microbulbifer donghaiensis]SHF76876.1 Pili and flagellar-assembly chaperone, PapD N-terminal domain [Microbulbifer donghaiensis]